MSWNHGQNRPNNGAVLKLQVDIGKCKQVGRLDPMMKTWHEHGYDSCWSPAGYGGERGEHCVREAKRIQVVDVYLAHGVKANDAGYRVIPQEAVPPAAAPAVWEWKE